MRETRALPVYVDRSDVAAMLRHAKCERDRLLIEFLWHTGARISEALAVRVGDLTERGVRMPNLKQGRFERQPDGTKRHISVAAEKHVMLPQDYLRELRAATNGLTLDTPLIGRIVDGRTLSRKTAWLIIKQCATAAGVMKRRFKDGGLVAPSCHKFRHGYAINLIGQGVPISAVQGQLGHASLANTQIYLQIVDPHRQALISGVKF